MQVRFVLEFTGDDPEVRAAILPLLRALDLDPVMVRGEPQPEGGAGPRFEPEDEDDIYYWTPETADQLVSEITERSRSGLRAITESAPETPFNAVLGALGTDGPTAGGIMGSISYAAKRMGAPLPFSRDYRKRVYLIDPDVASVILAAIQRVEYPE